MLADRAFDAFHAPAAKLFQYVVGTDCSSGNVVFCGRQNWTIEVSYAQITFCQPCLNKLFVRVVYYLPTQ